MDKKGMKKEPTIDLNPDQSTPKESSMVEEESIKGSKDGGTLVDTSVESQAVEPKSQPINPPKTTKVEPQELPKISEEQELTPEQEIQKRKAQMLKEIAEDDEKRNRIKLAEGITKQKREPMYEGEEFDEWNENEEKILRKLMGQTLSLPNHKNNDELKSEIQDILNNPDTLIYPSTQFGKDLRDSYLNNAMNASYKDLDKLKGFMNDLSNLRRLYAIATYSENENTRKEAIKRINKLSERTNAFVGNMDDEQKIELKNYMLLTEYSQAYEDLKYRRDKEDIWIIPQDGAPPIITNKEVKGAYKTTVGQFKGDIFRLLSNRSTGNIFLPSGLTRTRRRPNDTDLYEVDFDQLFNPNRYVELTPDKQQKLAKEGLTRYFEMTKPDYSQIVNAITSSTSEIKGAIEALKKQEKATTDPNEVIKLKKEIERLQIELDKANKAKSKAEKDLDDYRTNNPPATPKTEKEKNMEAKSQAKQAIDFVLEGQAGAVGEEKNPIKAVLNGWHDILFGDSDYGDVLTSSDKYEEFIDNNFLEGMKGFDVYKQEMGERPNLYKLFKIVINDEKVDFNNPSDPDLTPRPSDRWIIPSNKEALEVQKTLKPTTAHLISRAANYYKSIKDNKSKLSKKSIEKQLGIDNVKNLSKDEVIYLVNYPWVLPWLQAAHDMENSEERLEGLKEVVKKYKNNFSKYSYNKL